MSVESEARSSRPSTSQNEEVIEVCQIVMEDHCLALREIVKEVGISRGSVHSDISTKDLCMQRVLAKFIPKLLMEQQELCEEIAPNMLDCANNDLEFMKTIITGDKTRVNGYNPETKFHSLQWKNPKLPRPKKA